MKPHKGGTPAYFKFYISLCCSGGDMQDRKELCSILIFQTLLTLLGRTVPTQESWLQLRCLMRWSRSQSDQKSLALPLAILTMAITINSRAVATRNRLSITHSGYVCTSSCPFNSGAQGPRALELFLSYGRRFIPELFTQNGSAQFTLLPKKEKK